MQGNRKEEETIISDLEDRARELENAIHYLNEAMKYLDAEYDEAEEYRLLEQARNGLRGKRNQCWAAIVAMEERQILTQEAREQEAELIRAMEEPTEDVW